MSVDKYIIEIKNLTKRYQKLTAVDSISFHVKPGSIFAFLGPNGAGKSTTIKMLTTLTEQDEGQILINGFDPTRNQDQVRQSFGIVFQDSSLDDDLTAYENMDYHGVLYNVEPQLRKKRIKELLDIVELTDRQNSLVKTYSGGMKRRLEIARGLLHHPLIFFLDEPTLGLDPQTRNQIWDYIKDLNQKENTTIFFTTHYMEEAEKMAQQIAIIDHGQIITQGTAPELIKQTRTNNLEEAFISLTGRQIRKEEASSLDRMRERRKVFRR
ncbi:ATP-binding cassette domain-containing protein [Patescibacteria group bacterium]|nr:ATP-binding cassette domain-containing protein [Patescibacteria group bacterium]